MEIYSYVIIISLKIVQWNFAWGSSFFSTEFRQWDRYPRSTERCHARHYKCWLSRSSRPRSTTVTSPWLDARKFDHVTPLLVNLHWLRVPERIQYKLCVLMHRCLNGTAPQYLSEFIQPLSDVDSRCRLRFASMAEVLVPATRRSTIGDRALAVAGPRAWNNLPVDLRISRTFLLSKHTQSHICSTYPSLQFDCIIDYFLYRALEAACAAYVSLNLSLLHYITYFLFC